MRIYPQQELARQVLDEPLLLQDGAALCQLLEFGGVMEMG